MDLSGLFYLIVGFAIGSIIGFVASKIVQKISSNKN